MASDSDVAARAVRSLAQSWAEEMSLCSTARTHGGCDVTDLLGSVARSITRVRAEIAHEEEHGRPALASVYRHGQPRTTLTPRETDILTLVAQGYGTSEIAQRLGIATTTVFKRLVDANRALGTRSRKHAAEVALARGLITVRDTDAA